MKRYIALLVTVVALVALLVIPASAVGGVKVSTTSMNLKPGESKTFTITADNAAGRVDISSSNTAVATVSSSSEFLDNNTITITVKAVADGTAKINIALTNIATYDEEKLSGTKTISINVATPVTTTASSAANLKSLAVDGYTLSPSFNQWKTSYTVTVPEGTKSVNISAAALNAGATVTGTGTQTISSLPQSFKVVCKSANGETKTYTVTVKAPTVAKLSTLDVKAFCALTPSFDPSVLEYTATVPAGTTAVDVDAIIDESFKGSKVTVTGADDLAASNNVVTVVVTSDDGTTTTYKININYADEPVVIEQEPTVVESKGSGLPIWIIFIFIALIIIMSVVFFFLGRKYEGATYKKAYEEYGDDDDDKPLFGGYDN